MNLRRVAEEHVKDDKRKYGQRALQIVDGRPAPPRRAQLAGNGHGENLAKLNIN